MLEKKDILKHFGQSYVAEATRFEGTPPVITALAAGELDIGPLAFSSFGLAIQNAHMDDLRVICDEIQDGVAGHGTNEFMVLKDGPVKTVADLKGKVLATNAIGSAVDIAMRAMLRRSGLEANSDYTIVEAPFPAMRAMLAEKKADLDQRGAAVLARSRSERDGAQPVHAEGRIRHHATHDVDRAHAVSSSRTAPRWSIFSKTPSAPSAGTAIRKITKKPSPSSRASTRRRRRAWTGPSPAAINIATPTACRILSALQSNLQLQKQVGFLKDDIDVKKYSDVSMVEEAAKRLA